MLLYNSPGCASTVGGAPHGPTCLRMSPRTRNVISWSQCILSVYQTAGNFATFRHILVETHASVLQNQRWSYSRVGAPSAPQLSTTQAQAHRPHCRSTVPVCSFGLPDGRQIGYSQAYFGRNPRFRFALAALARCSSARWSAGALERWSAGAL